jgi:hypothetical protein
MKRSSEDLVTALERTGRAKDAERLRDDSGQAR